MERRGRRNAADHYIALPDRRVSRRHAEIYVLGDRIFLRDLGSKNGTYLIQDNRWVRLTESYVQSDQIVSFGGHRKHLASLFEAPTPDNGHDPNRSCEAED